MIDTTKLWMRLDWSGDGRYQVRRCDCHGIGVSNLVQKRSRDDWEKEIARAYTLAEVFQKSALESGHHNGEIMMASFGTLAGILIEGNFASNGEELRMALAGLQDLFEAFAAAGYKGVDEKQVTAAPTTLTFDESPDVQVVMIPIPMPETPFIGMPDVLGMASKKPVMN